MNSNAIALRTADNPLAALRDKRIQDGKKDAIAFGKAELHPLKGLFDIAFCPYMDEWNGVRSLKLSVKELRKL